MKKTYSFNEQEIQVIGDYLANAIADGQHCIAMTHEAKLIRDILRTDTERYESEIAICTTMLNHFNQD